MRTESMNDYWTRIAEQSEKALQVARANLARISLQDQLQLFDTSGQIIPFPTRVEIADGAA
jgi:hypothetical protein